MREETEKGSGKRRSRPFGVARPGRVRRIVRKYREKPWLVTRRLCGRSVNHHADLLLENGINPWAIDNLLD